MMVTRIVLLGSRGMLGNAFLNEFSTCRSSYEVIPLDRDELDITNRDEVFRVLLAFKPHIVINAAAYTAVDDAEMNREKAFSVNGDAVSHLADFCRKNSSIFAHFSTDYVFDGHAGHAGSEEDGVNNIKKNGYIETDIPNPLNVYGESKFSGEQKILESGIPFNTAFGYCGAYLIRTSWLFGPNGKNFVETMLRPGREKKEIRVVNDQIGKPTYTIDLAKATRKLIEEKMPFGIYHLVNETPVSWYEFAREIFHEIWSRCKMMECEETKSFRRNRTKRYGKEEAMKSAKRYVFCSDSVFSDIRLIPVSSDEFPRPARRPKNSVLLNTKFPFLRNHSEALRDYLKNR